MPRLFLVRPAMALLLFLLVACEDPSTVGLGIVGGEGGEPVLTEIPFTEFSVIEDEGIRDNNSRVLAGVVQDPVLGEVRAEGYIDFRNNTSLPPAYVEGAIEKIILRLQPEYLYGDTLTPITYGLHEVEREFLGRNATADSIPMVGPEIMQFTIMPTDTLVLAELPADWIAENDTMFKVIDFDNLFHGFMLNPISGNAVVGFSNLVTSESALRSIVETDTINFFAARSISHYMREGVPDLGESFFPMQNGVGPRLRVNFDLSDYRDHSLNRIVMRMEIDTTFYGEAENFVRPPLQDLSLLGVADDGDVEILLGLGVALDGTLDFDTANFRAVMQNGMLGGPTFDYLEIRFPVSTATGNTIDAARFYGMGDPDRKPRIFITTTRLD